MKRAFTLIELLIVVAIIAILAAIAVPNFLEAQVRAKVSRTKADMRTTDLALNSYAVDNNAFPNCHRFGIAMADGAVPGGARQAGAKADPVGTMILERLSTPIAYVANVLSRDPFTVRGRFSSGTAAGMNAAAKPTAVNPATDAAARYNSYIYQSWNSEQRYTTPPDNFSRPAKRQKSTAWLLHSAGPDGNYYNMGGCLANDRAEKIGDTISMIYDPTNGTVSKGSIWRAGGEASSSQTYAAGAGILKAIQSQK